MMSAFSTPRLSLASLAGLGAVLAVPFAHAAAPATKAPTNKVAATTRPAVLPTPPANGEMGFVLSSFVWAVHQGDEDCPDGLAGTVREHYLETLPANERTRLLLKQNEPELTQRWKSYAVGPDNTNICTNPELFDRPNQRMVQGKVSAGLDLDQGKPGCGHAEFTSPEGIKGIDNQAYRALGCTRNWRGVDGKGGDIRGFNNFLATGEHTMVLLLRGVDSLQDDPLVEMIWASTNDRPVLDTKRNFVSGASFSVAEAKWRNVLRGSIHNGVLTTQPADIRLNRRIGHGGVRGQTSEYMLYSARTQLAFQPDGTIKGLLGAYQTPRNLIATTLLGGVGAATVAGIDCAAEFQTLTRMADGLRDPATGQCTGVSTAYEVEAVPAFVNDLPASALQGSSQP